MTPEPAPSKPASKVPGPARRQVTIAYAHTGSQSYVYLVVKRQTVAGSVQFPVADLNHVLGLSIPQGQLAGADFAKKGWEEIRSYASGHFSITSDSQMWTINFTDLRFREMKNGSYVFLDYTVSGLKLTRPTRLGISFDGVVEKMPERDSLLIVMVSRGWGNLLRFTEQRLPVDISTTSHVVEVDKSSFGENLTASLAEGTLRAVRLPGRLARRLGRLTRRQ